CLKKAKQGIIVAGKLADRQEQAAVLKLSEKLNWPILPDISSGLRLGCSHPNIITHFDLALSTGTFNTDKPDCVLHLGGRITSKRFYEYIERVRPEHYITVLNHPLRNDPLHIVTLRIQGKVKNVCQQLLKSCSQRTDHKKLALWQKVNNTISEKLNHIFAENTAVTEPAVCRSLSRLLPKNTNLLLGNSLSIREMDSYADPGGASITVSANRGASGIDGTMATACGFIEGKSQPATLLLGDLSFLYDLNSLDMINRLQKPLIIIVFNNDGGGIFSFLPIANEKKLFETYFGTPHGRTFENIAKTFKIMYASPENMQDFENIYQKFSKNKQSVIIELKTQRAENRKWQTQVQNALKTKS
ncbi:MAG: 2-succinyl-5-enolpyruvyl-6-hydroxy-3-cyclohexene-1-carboxylate synthase, partial [Candidatus Omnitrophica bacterium]|nr:2-succinyl-5-enolpyruvyl-6-hydroxy-3-cyclohexene-1-carboxylate synthase [Candidatus Omnitrophota bacterium]